MLLEKDCPNKLRNGEFDYSSLTMVYHWVKGFESLGGIVDFYSTARRFLWWDLLVTQNLYRIIRLWYDESRSNIFKQTNQEKNQGRNNRRKYKSWIWRIEFTLNQTKLGKNEHGGLFWWIILSIWRWKEDQSISLFPCNPLRSRFIPFSWWLLKTSRPDSMHLRYLPIVTQGSWTSQA